MCLKLGVLPDELRELPYEDFWGLRYAYVKEIEQELEWKKILLESNMGKVTKRKLTGLLGR